LSNTNENGTIHVLPKILELNKVTKIGIDFAEKQASDEEESEVLTGVGGE